MTDINKLAAMSDEEFMNLSDKGELAEEELDSLETEKEDSEETNDDDNSTDDTAGTRETSTSDTEDTEVSGEDTPSQKSTESSDSGKDQQDVDDSGSDRGAKETPDDSDLAPSLEGPAQYEEFYKKVMAPIKANGKNIKLKTAEDVISLIQQGANYTKKMQSIAPYRKQLKMLEDNDLLDNEKIRFLIDVSKYDKDAIKKLLSEAKIDASELSYDEELDDEGNPKPVTYYPKTPNVTDQEVQWSEAWKELLEAEKLDNVDTHSIIMNMDNVSQKQVYENPQILMLLHQTQTCGAYDKIINEMERLKVLGYIKENSPFLSTFVDVKNMMLQNGMLNEELRKLNSQSQTRTSPQTFSRSNKKKSSVTNNDKARAAAPSRSSGKSTKPFLNPLTMSDEEFMKHYDEI